MFSLNLNMKGKFTNSKRGKELTGLKTWKKELKQLNCYERKLK